MFAIQASCENCLGGKSEFSGTSLIDSFELDEARRAVGALFVEHRLSAPSATDVRPITIDYRALNAVTICDFDYGREVEIDPEPFKEFYLLTIPYRGEMRVFDGNRMVASGAGTGVLLPFGGKLKLNWSSDARNMVVRIDRKRLQQCAERLLGEDLIVAPNFDLLVQWAAPATAPVRQALQMLLALDAPDPFSRPHAGQKAFVGLAEDTFLASLLLTQPNTLSTALADGRMSLACPRQVQKAQAFIDAHLADAITISDIAKATNVPARTLFETFKQFRGVSPMRYIKLQRFRRVHADLQQASPVETVTMIASRWGFNQLGRFAGEYAEQFGESPSQTLLAARRHH